MEDAVMIRRTLLASIVAIACMGSVFAAPIPKLLRKLPRFPDIRTAPKEILAEWSQDQEQWLALCRDQWPKGVIFCTGVERALADGTDLGEAYRHAMLLQIRGFLQDEEPKAK